MRLKVIENLFDYRILPITWKKVIITVDYDFSITITPRLVSDLSKGAFSSKEDLSKPSFLMPPLKIRLNFKTLQQLSYLKKGSKVKNISIHTNRIFNYCIWSYQNKLHYQTWVTFEVSELKIHAIYRNLTW